MVKPFSLVPPLVTFLVAANIFVFSIPNIPAIRYTLGGLAAILTAWHAIRNWKDISWPAEIRMLLVLYGTLTLWILFQALFISSETGWALKEFKGQWLVSTLYLCLGLGIVAMLTTEQARKTLTSRFLLTAITLVLASQILFSVLGQLWYFHIHHEWSFGYAWLSSGNHGGASGRTSMTFVSSALLALLITDTIVRLRRGKQLTNIPGAFLVALIAVDIFCLYLLRTRNGIIDAVILFIAATLVYALHLVNKRNWIRVVSGASITLLILGAAAYSSYKSDSRWETFFETIPIAWDTDSHKNWMTLGKYPVLPDGRTVDISAYERISMISEGIKLVADHPLGWGYGRNAFGHAIKDKYGSEAYSSYSHSHSALIDLAVSTGIPGLLLWLLFIGRIALTAWRGWKNGGTPEALLSLFLIINFIGRSSIDSIMRDHMMEQFMLLLGIYFTLAVIPAYATPSIPGGDHAIQQA